MLNAVQQAEPSPALHVFYASQTGNGEAIAGQVAAAMSGAGMQAHTQSVLRLKPATLRKLEYAVFIVSTHGEGDPPDDALDLFDALKAARNPQLGGLQFRILALGDSSYLRFCEAGRELERLLTAQGARPFARRVECDLEYQEPSDEFIREVLEFGHEKGFAAGPRAVPAATATTTPDLRLVRETECTWKRERPFPATLETVSPLTTRHSVKDTHHVVLSLSGSDIRYQPGDALGVLAPNDPELVSELLRRLNIDPATKVSLDGQTRTVRDWLSGHKEITRLTPDLVRAWAERTLSPGLRQRIESMDETALRQFIEQRQLIDLAQEYRAAIDAAGLLSLLRPLAPRSYSIASSQAAVEDEVHLTVVTQQSNAVGVPRQGVASGFLNGRVQPGDTVQVFAEPNTRFRLPDNPSAPLIMIGAGTGIAPYRAFMQDLEAQDRKHRAWLIFGNPHLREDFLYQSEWLAWRASGLLERIDTAFSRDQAEKRYVQHVLREQAERLCEWLDWGAHIYICGALSMGHAVESALAEAIASRHELDSAEAAARVAGLRREQRLMKDLY